MAAYHATLGNLGVEIALRDLDETRAEIVVLRWWPDLEKIRAFARDDISRARYFPENDRYLLTRSERVQHYLSSRQ